ncbi:cytochrome P450 CYP12A2-like [Anticarsia gemmatalis]|uniref:cytochrome P450 CYP12A2-like n=1 Tax=Anticarsia gemmatalis TaxID=129554 RepID=UPI003F75728F
MQMSKLRPVVKLSRFNKEFVRTVVIASTSVKTDTVNLKPWNEIPGPKCLPIIGQFLDFLPGGELYNFTEPKTFVRLMTKYGPMIRFDQILGLKPMLLVGDPEIAEQVLRSENMLPSRPGFSSLEYYRRNYKSNKGDEAITGLITDHDKVWKAFRSTVNPVMLQPKTIRLYHDALIEVAEDMVKRMKADRNDKNMLQRDFGTEMNMWALESIGTIALGCRLNCLEPSLPEDSPARELISCVHELFFTADQLDFKPSLWRYIATPTFKKAMRLYARHDSLIKHFVKKGIEQLNQNVGQKTNNEKGVLEKLLEINEEFAYIMASDMLFAGVDTAAMTVTATMYLLAANQEKQNKLREEILSRSDKTPYLKACIKESMRLLPVITGNLRQTTKEYNIRGYRVPKGVNIAVFNSEITKLEKYFPRATEYIPERWITDKNDPLYYGNAHPFAHSPFGFGVRSCIGRRIAELEVEIFLSRLIENFHVEWFGPPPQVEHSSLNYIKPPFNFILNDVK